MHMAILKETQDILNSMIQNTFRYKNFIPLTYAETDTNRLLLKSLHEGHFPNK